MAYQNVFIVGATGNVGAELIREIALTDSHRSGHENPTRLVGIANSQHLLVNPSGIEFIRNSSSQGVQKVLSAKEIRQVLTTKGQSYGEHEDFLQAVKDAGLNGEVVFVDVTSDDGMTDFQRRVILNSPNQMVTANKKPLADTMEIFRDLTRYPHRYRYNAAVMAGGTAVTYLQQAHLLSETLLSIQATLSGTGAFICSELEKKRNFSEIVREAKMLKYTEPHPGEDLSGKDVMRKLLILVRSAGISISESDVELKGFVNMDKYEGLSPDDFLNAIKAEDHSFSIRVQEEDLRWNVPRYIAQYSVNKNGDPEIKVGLQYVPRESEMARGSGTANKILIHTSGRSPLWSPPEMSSCAGAGVEKTAAAVRANLGDFLSGANLWAHK